MLFSKEKNSKIVSKFCGKIENVLNEFVGLVKEIFNRILEVLVCFFELYTIRYRKR